MIYEATLCSAREKRNFTKITDSYLSEKVIKAIQQQNAFHKVNNIWLRANITLVDTKDNVADRILSLTSKLDSEYNQHLKIALTLKKLISYSAIAGCKLQ